MTSKPQEPGRPPKTSKRPGAKPPKPPPNAKVVVPIALLVCCALAMALYAASFRSRPPLRQPAVARPR